MGATHGMSDLWRQLIAELDAWRENGRSAAFWWRDDDAIEDTDALQRLLSLSTKRGIPIVLAVIPDRAAPCLVDATAPNPSITIAQHGCAHRNHAAPGEKAAELGGALSDAEVLQNLEASRGRIGTLFGDRLSGLLVPPWNRMRASIIPGLPAIGVNAVSGFDSKDWQEVDGLRIIDTHVDIINWRGTRGFAGEDKVLSQIIRILGEGRQAMAPEQLGMLTHHLDHDDGCWQFMDRLSILINDHPGAAWRAVA